MNPFPASSSVHLYSHEITSSSYASSLNGCKITPQLCSAGWTGCWICALYFQLILMTKLSIFFKNMISEKLWHFDPQKQTLSQRRSNQRCKLTSKIGLTGPTPNKESQVELICAALNHIGLKEPHNHISAQQMADCFSVLCKIRHGCGRFSPEGHISCTQEAYVLWFYNMGENKPSLQKCSTLANAETSEDIEESLCTAFRYNNGVSIQCLPMTFHCDWWENICGGRVWIYKVRILKFYSEHSQVLSFSTSIDRI